MTERPLAFITGGQQGIGLGIAEALAAAGFAVAIASEQPADAPAVLAARERMPEMIYLTHDLRDAEGSEALVARLTETAGPIAAYVSNAGVPSPVRGDMLDILPANFDFVLDVNLRGAFFLAKAVARHMLAASGPTYRSMSFVTSVSAEMVSVGRADYCISKAGASMMASLFAARLAGAGIGVFELRPGIIETAMTAAVKDTYSQRIADGLVPAGRWGTPADIGAVIVPIATGRMAFATGAVIPVDGGLSIARL